MQINSEMTSSRPYLLRALNEWIIDNNLTPHIVVDATFENVVVPTQYVEEDRIVLNINPGAVSHFNITNEFISFSARFSGKAMEIFVPVSAVMALYAKENGQGMVFNEERTTSSVSASSDTSKTKRQLVQAPSSASTSTSTKASPSRPTSGKPSLKLVD